MKLILPICLLFAFSLPAQEMKWEVNLGTSRGGIIADVIQTIDGEVAVIGNENDGTCYFELLRQSDGVRVLEQPLVFQEKGTLTAITQLYDGTFILVGHRFVSQKGSDGWWLKVNKKGEILANKTFGEKEKDGFNDVITAVDGDVVIVGYKTENSVQKAWFLKTNPNGLSPRMTTYQSVQSKKDEARAVVEGENGQFGITGVMESNNRNDANIWIMSVDEYGQRSTAEIKIVGIEKKQKISKLWEESTDIIATQDGNFVVSGFQGPGSLRNNWLAAFDKNGKITFHGTINTGAYEGAEEGRALTQLFDGRIVIGGLTEGYQRGAGNSPKMFVQMIDKNTYKPAPVIYFNKSNRAETITRLCPTYDGNLLIAGQKYQNGAGAWLALYLLNQNIDFETDTNLIANFNNIETDNQNVILEANERGYALLDLKNVGNRPLFGLRIRIKGNVPKGVTIPDTIFVNQIFKQQTKNIAIPIAANNEVEIKVANLELILENAKGKHLKTIPWTLFTGEALAPNLQVTNYQFEAQDNKITNGSAFDLVLEIKNTGHIAAISPSIDLTLPKGVTMPTDWQLTQTQLDTNQTITATIPLAVLEDYADTLIAIQAQIKALNQTAITQQQQQQFTANVQTFFADITWREPSIEYANDVVYNTTDDKLLVRVEFLSNIEIEQGRIELYLNDVLIKQTEADRATLQKTNINGYKQRAKYQYQQQIHLTKPGKNKIYFRYKDSRLTQPTVSKTLYLDFKEERPILYILAIGAAYKNNPSVPNPTYTESDAAAFAAAFDKQIGSNPFFDTIIVAKLIGEDASALNIKQAIEDMANHAKTSKGKAMILTYISAYADIRNEEFILFAEDYTPTNANTHINYKEDIINKLARIKGSNRLIFIDARKGVTPNNTATTDILLSEKLHQLIQASGFITFAACSPQQSSWEDTQWQNGAFTKAMLEAFANKAVTTTPTNENKETADKDNNHILTISEFINFVQLRVPYIVQQTKNQQQNPTISEQDGINPTMPLYITD